MNDNEKRAQKSLQDYNDIPHMEIDEVYLKAQLTPDEAKTLKNYHDILGDKLRHYAHKWLVDSKELNGNNRIKHIASVLLKCERSEVTGDLRSFLATLFSGSMNYGYEIKESGFRIGPKSDQFEDIFFELELLDFLIDRGYKINLGKALLKNGKKAEFWAENKETGFYVEAKNLNSNELHEIIYGDKYRQNRAMGIFSLSEDQERKIRSNFKNQYRLAKQKFSNSDASHSIYIKLNFPLGTLGEKLQIYINKMLNTQDSETLKYIGIFTSNKIYLYDHVAKNVETIIV